MLHYEYDDRILMCGTGAGFVSVECMTGIYRAFEEWGIIPGRVHSSSGSTLFSSLYYSVESTKWFDALMDSTIPSDFIDFNITATIKVALSRGTYMLDNTPVHELLRKNMTGNATKRVTTSVTRNSDWTSHMRQVTPGWATAATSIPFIFKPVKIGDHFWSDGGVLNNLPVPSMEETKQYEHIFVFVPPKTEYNESEFIINQLLNLLYAVMERENEQLKEMGFFDLPNVSVIQPDDSFGGSLLGWSPDFKLKENSYLKAKEVLKNVEIY